MDADRRFAAAWALALLLTATTGCLTDPYLGPQSQPTRREEPDPARRQVEVVHTPASQPAVEPSDPIEADVSRYIARVENARTLRPPPVPTLAADALAEPLWVLSGSPPSETAQPAVRPPPTVPADRPVSAAPPAAAQEASSNMAPAPDPTSDPSPAPPPPAPPPAPTLTTLTARSEPPGGLPPSRESDAPAVNAPAAARVGLTSLREYLERSPQPDDAPFRDQLDRRVLWAIAGDYEQARAPLRLVTAEQQQLAARFVETWIALREAHEGDLAAAATAARGPLAELEESLRRLADLSIPALKICSVVRGFGQYDEISPPRLPAGGAEFVLYCEIRDFVSELRGDGLYLTTFDLTTTIFNRAGDIVLELRDTDIVDRSRNRRQDCFIPRLVRLPASLPPGRYVAKVTVADKLGKKVAENSAAFELTARP